MYWTLLSSLGPPPQKNAITLRSGLWLFFTNTSQHQNSEEWMTEFNVLEHSWDPRTWKAGAEKVQDGGQRGLHSETVSKLVTTEEATSTDQPHSQPRNPTQPGPAEERLPPCFHSNLHKFFLSLCGLYGWVAVHVCACVLTVFYVHSIHAWCPGNQKVLDTLEQKLAII